MKLFCIQKLVAWRWGISLSIYWQLWKRLLCAMPQNVFSEFGVGTGQRIFWQRIAMLECAAGLAHRQPTSRAHTAHKQMRITHVFLKLQKYFVHENWLHWDGESISQFFKDYNGGFLWYNAKGSDGHMFLEFGGVHTCNDLQHHGGGMCHIKTYTEHEAFTHIATSMKQKVAEMREQVASLPESS